MAPAITAVADAVLAGLGGDLLPRVERVEAQAFTLPTDGPDGLESDGTLEWSATTLVLVQVFGGGCAGLGYTYGDRSVVAFVNSMLAPALVGADLDSPPAAWRTMNAAIRNAGRPGLGAMALAAVDVALWDLAARARGVALTGLLPTFRDTVPVYESGGFTNYSDRQLAAQAQRWVEGGARQVKIKISRSPASDPDRLTTVRRTVGTDVALFTDANGALDRAGAQTWARRLAEHWGVTWFEEPVSSEDVAGLRIVRDAAPVGLDIAAGEYGYVLGDFAELLRVGAVDCLQADVTRCGGITGLLQVGGLAAARGVDLSAHCAPAVSAHAFCTVPRVRHLEHFHDHVRFEALAFDGVARPIDGALHPDPGRPGLGLEVRWADLAPYRVA